MPRTPSLTPRKIISVLKRHGFRLHHTSGSHFVFKHPESKRRVTIAYHAKELPRGTLTGILKQSGLSFEDFV